MSMLQEVKVTHRTADGFRTRKTLCIGSSRHFPSGIYPRSNPHWTRARKSFDPPIHSSKVPLLALRLRVQCGLDPKPSFAQKDALSGTRFPLRCGRQTLAVKGFETRHRGQLVELHKDKVLQLMLGLFRLAAPLYTGRLRFGRRLLANKVTSVKWRRGKEWYPRN